MSDGCEAEANVRDTAAVDDWVFAEANASENAGAGLDDGAGLDESEKVRWGVPMKRDNAG